MSAQAQQLLQADQGMLLVDVRPREQFDIAHIPGACWPQICAWCLT